MQTSFVPKTRADAGCVLLLRATECGGAIVFEEGIRPCGTSSSLQGDETGKPQPFLDVFDCSDLE